MSVVVSFITAAGIGGTAQGVGRIRHQERLAVPGTTATDTQVGDIVVIGNNEAGMVAAAFGTAPDADATDESATTSAGMPIPAGQMSIPMSLGGGKKVNIKAVP